LKTNQKICLPLNNNFLIINITKKQLFNQKVAFFMPFTIFTKY
jgi:hypothetical protein